MVILIVFWLLLFFGLITLIVSIYNYTTRPILKAGNYDITSNHKLSILIPARNEEKNIGRLLGTLSNLPDIHYEVIVLNDNSTDATGAVVKEYINASQKIKLINGRVLPSGWLGKNYACHTLAKEASGEVLLFLDADVQIQPGAISSLLFTLRKEKAAMVSVFPSQKMVSVGEKLIVPLMNWLLLSFLPLRLVRTSANTKFVAANGQCILITKSIYMAIGGHEAFKAHSVEDMAIARALKKRNMPIVTLLGGNLIACRMYTGFTDAVTGFTKNFFRGFEVTPIVFVILLLFFYSITLYPLVLAFYFYPFILIYFIHLVGYALISKLSSQSVLRNIILAPIQFLLLQFIGIRSLLFTLAGKLEWKGRKIG